MKEKWSALASVLQREKCEKSNFAKYKVMGHYRENNNEQIANAFSGNSG